MRPMKPSQLGATTSFYGNSRDYAANTWTGRMSLSDCARRIVDTVNQFGLRPVPTPQAPQPIEEDDLGRRLLPGGVAGGTIVNSAPG